jgi:hypothetical protein
VGRGREGEEGQRERKRGKKRERERGREREERGREERGRERERFFLFNLQHEWVDEALKQHSASDIIFHSIGKLHTQVNVREGGKEGEREGKEREGEREFFLFNLQHAWVDEALKHHSASDASRIK